jgi:hypothetical protein
LPQDKQKTLVHHRLSKEAYLELEKQLGLTQPQSNTTDIQAGYMLGICQALKVIRTGFTVDQ